MANPTTYFGWVMPNSADLVTDLPADFNVFGQGVDTSMQYLLGGTTGQILSKTSGTNMAFTWINNDQGDITGVTAGTGISGGGTSGTVTVTNSMATEITAAGDIIVGTGSGTFDNLPIGTTAQVLTADTTVSPYKVKWAAPTTAAFVGCSLTKVANQTTSAATYTVITFTSEEFDTNGFHDNSTNTSRITIPTGYAGKYLITGQISTTTGTETHTSAIKLNGSNFNTMTSVYSAQSGAGGSIQNVIMNLAVGDYVEFSQYSVNGVQVNGTAANSRPSSFACQYLGA